MKEIGQYIAGLDFSPLLISLKTGVVATVFSLLPGDIHGAEGSPSQHQGKKPLQMAF